MFVHFAHLFGHHTTNNQKARLLHVEGFLALVGIILASSVFVHALSGEILNLPAVLGFTSSITADQTVTETNALRASKGLTLLTVDKKLVDAALAKGNNMCQEQYWAHFSPSGTSPWSFMKNAGYSYSVAGENLARDFADTKSMVAAWVASPTHNANLIHPRYTNIGVAVVYCKLLGSDTALVVQMFGSPAGSAPNAGKIPKPVQNQRSANTQESQNAQVAGEEVEQQENLPVQQLTDHVYILTPLQVQKAIALALIALVVCVLVFDMWLVEKKNTVRVSSRSLGHLFFFVGIAFCIAIIKAGATL